MLFFCLFVLVFLAEKMMFSELPGLRRNKKVPTSEGTSGGGSPCCGSSFDMIVSFDFRLGL